MNPRDFSFADASTKDIILIDDIITTGSTLTQAIDTISKNGSNILFCLTLVDVGVN